MKILQFAFDADGDSDYLPHNYTENSVVYTGTHDNDTTVGWFWSMSRKDRNFAKRYLNFKGNKNVEWEFIRAALSSVANTAIIPMQDYLGLGKEARINIPSTLGENWKWRMRKGQTSDELAQRIYDISKLYARVHRS